MQIFDFDCVYMTITNHSISSFFLRCTQNLNCAPYNSSNNRKIPIQFFLSLNFGLIFTWFFVVILIHVCINKFLDYKMSRHMLQLQIYKYRIWLNEFYSIFYFFFFSLKEQKRNLKVDTLLKQNV